MILKKEHSTPIEDILSRLFLFIAVLSGIAWTWAVALLTTRHHLVGTYRVIQGAPYFWGAVALPVPLLLFILVLGALLTLLCVRYTQASRDRFPRAMGWLLVPLFVPVLDLLRLLGIPIPLTFAEPLVLVFITAMAVGAMVAVLPVPSHLQRRIASVPWLAVVWVVAILLGVWWYLQSVQAYDAFMLGFNDFGHFGQRVANTWSGRGFLMETPSLPPFWDHFNPGLALLAPLWGLWPDPKLFIVIQAVCLILSAPIVYAIALHLGATQIEAAMWATAYLLYPPLSQLNLSYSYGWHPVSLTLPLLFLALLCLLRGQRIGALLACLLACSFREDVVVILGCLAAAMVLQAGWTRWRGQEKAAPSSGARIVADRLPIRVWATINLVLVIAFVLIYQFSGFREFQVSRFDKLGETGLEIVASPVLRPWAFWGTVLRPESAYFLLMLLVPLGLKSLLRGRWTLLACGLPVGVLLAWGHRPATSIAFQYSTTLIPILFLAAMVGARRTPDQASSEAATGPMWRATVTTWIGCAAASLWLGASPWCQNTLTDVLGQTYCRAGGVTALENRLPGSEGIKLLHEVVALVDRDDARVLATGRIAAHFVGARRVDTVGQAPQRWAAFEQEAGPGHSGIELFDWVVIDTYEQFFQSPKNMEFILDQAKSADYHIVEARLGVVVLARPAE